MNSKRREEIEFWLLALLAVALPLLLRGPQWFVGTAVNAAIVLGALRLSGWRRLMPLLVLPAVAATAGGFLFGQPILSVFIWLWPAIWAGNALLAGLVRSLHVRRGRPLLLVVALAAPAKALLIGSAAALLAAAGGLPWEFVWGFAAVQFATAMAGGTLAMALGGRAAPRRSGRGD